MAQHQNPSPLSIVMVGGTGAVGSEVIRTLLRAPSLQRLTLLGRRPVQGLGEQAGAPEGTPITTATDLPKIEQNIVDVLDPGSYRALLGGHQIAICTLGVGQPSTMSKEQFLRIDKLAVLDFAQACREAGVEHFLLLSSVGASAGSRSFYLRSKGELQDGLRALGFQRLSLFQPSMILTPHNRYGVAQAITLRIWPWLRVALIGPLRKYRGIRVAALGRAIANCATSKGQGDEILQWDDFVSLADRW